MNIKARLGMLLCMLMIATASFGVSATKVLVIGDSMTGWLGDRLNAYGAANGFSVATVIWDGATIQKYADSPRFAQILAEQNPDIVVLSLGMNNLFEPNPAARLNGAVDRLLSTIGHRQVIWIGPVSWPGKGKGDVVDNWLASKLGPEVYFSTFGMNIPRQTATNPHPTQAGSAAIIDALADWISANTTIDLNVQQRPAPGKMQRPATFIYRRMKQPL